MAVQENSNAVSTAVCFLILPAISIIRIIAATEKHSAASGAVPAKMLSDCIFR